jgi:hypothetical protein
VKFFSESLQKYVYEVVVIFVGITLGFLFDEWRDRRIEEKERLELKQSMKAELIRIKSFFVDEQSGFSDQVAQINEYLTTGISDTSSLLLFVELTREVSYLEGTFYHVNAIARGNASRITTNRLIAENLTFIGNMENDLARMKDDTRQIVLKSIWPTMMKYGVDRDIHSLALEDKLILTGNYRELKRSHLLDGDLRLLSIKLNGLAGVSTALVDRIDEILTELDNGE